jgi:hypothetical protein
MDNDDETITLLQWRPIETAPKGEPVLVFNDGGVSVAEYVQHTIKGEGRWECEADGYPARDSQEETICLENPTHWMPLPKLPKEE